MQTYLKIGMVCSVLLVSSCSAPVKVMAPPPPPSAPAPYRICAEGQTPELDGCCVVGATSTIAIRGAKSSCPK